MSENVCIDVTETKCEVVPYKECKVRKYLLHDEIIFYFSHYRWDWRR